MVSQDHWVFRDPKVSQVPPEKRDYRDSWVWLEVQGSRAREDRMGLQV